MTSHLWKVFPKLFYVFVTAVLTAGMIALVYVATTPVPTEEPIVITVFGTAYDAQEGFTNCRLLAEQYPDTPTVVLHTWHSNTKSGTESDWGTMAVDPAVIPFGSIIYDVAYADMCGRYLVALDTGGAIKGNRIDMWTETDTQAFSLTGLREITVLRLGWDSWLVDPVSWGLLP